MWLDDFFTGQTTSQLIPGIANMYIKTLFFATCREITGERETAFDLVDGASVSDLIEKICGEHSAFRSMEASLMVSVNQSYVDRDQELKEGDEVAFIPPVSGG
jgi:molybdopterin converting factor subunit 1